MPYQVGELGRCKGPEAAACLVHSRHKSQKARMSEWGREERRQRQSKEDLVSLPRDFGFGSA